MSQNKNMTTILMQFSKFIRYIYMYKYQANFSINRPLRVSSLLPNQKYASIFFS